MEPIFEGLYHQLMMLGMPTVLHDPIKQLIENVKEQVTAYMARQNMEIFDDIIPSLKSLPFPEENVSKK